MTLSLVMAAPSETEDADTPVFTIGYEKHTPDTFVQTLARFDVKRLIDVRELPLSRRKGFSKTALAAKLRESGIEYVHVREAGNPFRAQKGDIETCLRLYAGHLEEHTVKRVLDLALSAPSALLCVEQCAHECHRSVLANRMRAALASVRIVNL
jgi:uncharacterized protein (DUF488 family)